MSKPVEEPDKERDKERDKEPDEDAEEGKPEDQPSGGVVLEKPIPPDASWEELLQKRADGEEEEESVLDLSREDRTESLSIRAIPPQANEFVCRSCHLVKHLSQLADRKRRLCRDCV